MIHSLWGFLNSSFFVAIVTISAGLIAFVVYYEQKRDNKRNAANIILLEVQNAERLLRQSKENLKQERLEDNIYVMQTESWSKYKYLFVRDFDRDEWDALNEFYHKCQLFDSAVFHQSSLFQKNEEQVRINLIKITADYINTCFDKSNENKVAVLSKINQFQEEYLKCPHLFYLPQKPIRDAKSYFDNWNINITQTNIGVKLKKLAGLKK